MILGTWPEGLKTKASGTQPPRRQAWTELPSPHFEGAWEKQTWSPAHLKRAKTILRNFPVHCINPQSPVAPSSKTLGEIPRRQADVTRCQRPITGERVQMNTCEIAHDLYQYAVIDGCIRYRVLLVYARLNTNNTLDFIDSITEKCLFLLRAYSRIAPRSFLPSSSGTTETVRDQIPTGTTTLTTPEQQGRALPEDG